MNKKCYEKRLVISDYNILYLRNINYIQSRQKLDGIIINYKSKKKMTNDNLKLSLLSEIYLTDDELLVVQGGDKQLDHINCGEGCGLGCGRGCGAGCSSCTDVEEPIHNMQV